MRTISEPALCKAATCATVESTSAVSVLVMDCTTTGALPPTTTPPTSTPTDWRRGKGYGKYLGVSQDILFCSLSDANRFVAVKAFTGLAPDRACIQVARLNTFVNASEL